MQKTYWWRMLVVILSTVIFSWGYLAVNAFKIGLCAKASFCLFKYGSYIDPLMFFSIFLFVTATFLFFVQDIVFKKWLRFAIAWAVFTAILVALAPTYTGGWMSFGPTKESVSIWMGALFVILSLIQLIWQSRKIKQ